MSARKLHFVPPVAPADLGAIPYAHLALPETLPEGITREEAESLLSALRSSPAGPARMAARIELHGRGVFSDADFDGPPKAAVVGPRLVGEVPPQGKSLKELGGPVPMRPRNLEAENLAIAAVLARPDAIGEIFEHAPVEQFDGGAQRSVLRIVCSLLDQQLPVDPVLIRDRLSNDSESLRCGAPDCLEAILKLAAPDAARAIEYAKLIHEKFVLREEDRLKGEIGKLSQDGRLRNGTFQNRANDLVARLAELHSPRENSGPEIISWPEPAGEAALHGLAGDVVRIIDPVSEADPMAVLGQFLALVGSMAGRNPCWYHEETRHSLNLFMVIVGPSSIGAKGVGWKNAVKVVRDCDPVWKERTGLISGEGLIHSVRNPSAAQTNSKMSDRQQILAAVFADVGVTDKRLMYLETEFNSVLTAKARLGNTLKDQLCKAWDGDPLGRASKNDPSDASDYHCSMIAHITGEELIQRFPNIDKANGLGNRMLFPCSIKSKSLPSSDQIPRIDWEKNGIRARIRAALAFARTDPQGAGELVLERDEEAARIWEEVYPSLDDPGPGVLGKMKSRAKPLVMRIAAIYAVLDCSRQISAAHLRAALAYWDYCSRSLTFVFGSRGQADEIDANEERVFQAIREAGESGLSLGTVTAKLFRGKAHDSNAVLNNLVIQGRIRSFKQTTKGREATVYVVRSLGHNTCALSFLRVKGVASTQVATPDQLAPQT